VLLPLPLPLPPPPPPANADGGHLKWLNKDR